MSDAEYEEHGLDLPQFELAEFVRRVLAEDLGSGGDVTSKATIDASARFSATLNCREPIVVAGLDLVVAFFRATDREVRFERTVADGDAAEAGGVLLRVEGNARAMLAAERSALNTLQHLSGIATLTRAYVDVIVGTGATLLDTRKTIPGMRLLDNMPPDTLRQAVALVAGRVPLEASGGVRLDTIRAIAESGVDYVSVGRITQSAPAVDIGLDYALAR